MSNETPDRLVGIEEAAARFGVGPGTLRRMVHRGAIPAYRVGKVLRFDLAKLEEIFLAAGKLPYRD